MRVVICRAVATVAVLVLIIALVCLALSSRLARQSRERGHSHLPVLLRSGVPEMELWSSPDVTHVDVGATMGGRSTSFLCLKAHPDKVLEVHSAQGPFGVYRISDWRLRDRRHRHMLTCGRAPAVSEGPQASDTNPRRVAVVVDSGLATNAKRQQLVNQLEVARTLDDIVKAFDASHVVMATNSLYLQTQHYRSGRFSSVELAVTLNRGRDGELRPTKCRLYSVDRSDERFVDINVARRDVNNVARLIRKGIGPADVEEALSATSVWRLGGLRDWLCLLYRSQEVPEKFVHVYYRRDDNDNLSVYDWELSVAREIEGFRTLDAAAPQ